MCGILGAWQPIVSKIERPRFEAALRLLAHRGPNDSGLELFDLAAAELVLGHTRLSVIDLSSGGHQPMYSPCGRYALIFNGEIYNYRELRDELRALGHRFVSDSDTEVLLACWRQWGRDCLPRLSGMFAFVIFDREAATLTCVRDAFGIKPFFYTEEDGRFLFASELPPIKALKTAPFRLNWQRSYDYLVHGDYDTNAETFVDGVVRLLPGHLIEVDLTTGAAGEPKRWWAPSIAERTDLRFASAVELVRAQFLENIKLHLRSDVPLGSALSGGVDSSAVVCSIRHVDPSAEIHTFSFIAKDNLLSEEAWVDRVNAHVGAHAHKVFVDGQDLAADLDDMIAVQGEPFGSTSIYAQYRVFKLARQQGVIVTLDGQGADEMMAGYSGYPGQRLRSLLEQGRLREAYSFLDAWAQWPGRRRADAIKRTAGEFVSGLTYDLLRRLNGMDSTPCWIRPKPLADRGIATRFPQRRPEINERGRRVTAALADSLIMRGLPTLLRHGDRNSMRFSVESRVPFLTVDLVNLLLSLPEEYLISRQGETKHVFRAAMRGIVPDDILDRRDKIGFATPERDWLLGIAPQVRIWLEEDPGVPFIDQPQILHAFDEIVAGTKPFSWQVWRWINFFRWHRKFIST